MRNDLCYNEFNAPFFENGYLEHQRKIVLCQEKKTIFNYVENNWLPSEEFITGAYNVENYFEEIRKCILLSKTHKESINAVYDAIIPNDIKMGSDFNTWRYNLLLPDIKKRDAILNSLFAEDLYASAHYRSVAGIFKNLKCPNAIREEERIMNLFNEQKYTIEMAEKTAYIISKCI